MGEALRAIMNPGGDCIGGVVQGLAMKKYVILPARRTHHVAYAEGGDERDLGGTAGERDPENL